MKVFNFLQNVLIGSVFTASLFAGVLTATWLLAGEHYGGFSICVFGGIAYAIYCIQASKETDELERRHRIEVEILKQRARILEDSKEEAAEAYYQFMLGNGLNPSSDEDSITKKH